MSCYHSAWCFSFCQLSVSFSSFFLIFLLRFDYCGDSFTNFPFIWLVQCCCSGEKNKGTQVRFHDVKFLITADQFHGMKIFTLNFTEWKFTPISFLHYWVSRRESFHWSFMEWLVSRQEWKFFSTEWTLREFLIHAVKIPIHAPWPWPCFLVKSISPLFTWRVTYFSFSVSKKQRSARTDLKVPNGWLEGFKIMSMMTRRHFMEAKSFKLFFSAFSFSQQTWKLPHCL